MAKKEKKEKAITTRVYKIELFEPLLGTLPKNKEIFTKYVQGKYYPIGDVDDGVLDEEMMQRMEEEQTLLPDGDKETGFYSDGDGVYLMDYHIKGFLKEAGNILKEIIGIKALRSKIDNFVFVFPRHIWLKEKIDGRIERPVRGQTPQGPRTSLISSDCILPPCSFNIEITLLYHKEVKWDTIETLLDYGRLKGFGQWRNASWGRFTWSFVEEKDTAFD